MNPDNQDRQTLISAGIDLWNNSIPPTLKAAVAQTGISRTVAYRIFDGTHRGVDDEYRHQVATRALSQRLAGEALEPAFDLVDDLAIELPTEDEATAYLAATIQQAANQIDAWIQTDDGKTYLRSQPLPPTQPHEQISFAGQLSYVLSGVIGEHLTLYTAASQPLDVRLTGWVEDPYALIGRTETGEVQYPIADVDVVHIHPHNTPPPQ